MAVRRPGAVLPLAGLLAAYLLAPFLAAMGQVGGADWAGVDLPALAQAGLVSVGSATLATVLVAAGGIPLGYLLARVPGRGMAVLGFVVQLPLALPPLASGVLLLFLLGYASPLGRLTGGALTDSFTGIVLAEAFVAAPFLIVAARSAFAAVDPTLEDVAATLGHRPGAVFRRVSLALAAPGIWAGVLLTWLRAFGEFGATVMVAYHPYSLPVYTYIAFGSQGLPAMLPVVLPTILVAAVVMALSLRGRRPSRRPLAEPLPRSRPALPPGGAAHPARPLRLALRRRLPGFTLDVAWQTEARRLCILGASGSGKSATLRLLAGLDPAEQAVSLNGRDLGPLPPDARGVAYVPQSFGLLPHLAVARQIRFGVGCDPARARHWTERLGLAGLEHRRPAELSMGQQQRVALARALSRPADLLLLDEPFSALDAPLRAGCGTSCWPCRGRSGRPPSSSRTTRRRRSCWPTRCCCWRKATCCKPARSTPCSNAPPARRPRACWGPRRLRPALQWRPTGSISAACASPSPVRPSRSGASAGRCGSAASTSGAGTACRAPCWRLAQAAPGSARCWCSWATLCCA